MAGMMSSQSGDEEGASSDTLESSSKDMASGLGNVIGSAAGTAKVKVVVKTTPKPTTGPTTPLSMGFELMFLDVEEEEPTPTPMEEDFVETDPTKNKVSNFPSKGQSGVSV